MPYLPRWTILLFGACLILSAACTSTVTATPQPAKTSTVSTPAVTRVYIRAATYTPAPPERASTNSRRSSSLSSVSSASSTKGSEGLSNSQIASTMKQNPGVLDAAVSKRGNQISLVVIVGPLTSKSRAKQLGDSFVRLYKSLSDDDPPGSSIGRGKYSYSIGVYTPDEKPLVVGAKASVANRISW